MKVALSNIWSSFFFFSTLNSFIKGGYIRVDKETMRMKALSEEEFRTIKASKEE